MHFCLELIHLCLCLGMDVQRITDGLVEVFSLWLPDTGPHPGHYSHQARRSEML